MNDNAPLRPLSTKAGTPEEQAAAELFGAARPLPPLSNEALARIEVGITAKMAAAASAAVVTKVVLGALLVTGGGAAVWAWSASTGRDAVGGGGQTVAAGDGAPAEAGEAALPPGPAAPQALPLPTEPTSPPAPQPLVETRPAASAEAERRPSRPEPERSQKPQGAPSAAPVDTLAIEAELLSSALRNARKNPPVALAALAEHQRRFPQGQLAPEAQRAKLDVLMALGRNLDAAQQARTLRANSSGARALELTVVEAEQLRAAGRLRGALSRFERAIADGATGAVAERAWYGRASCRRSLGDAVGAHRDAAEFLRRFPQSRRATELSGWLKGASP